MNGDGPCQPQGVLREAALHLGLNLARLGVQRVAGVLPLQRLYLDSLLVARAEHQNLLLVDVCHPSYAPIIIEVIARGVVLDEHHLGAHLQHQRLGRRVVVLGKRALDFRPEPEGARSELLQSRRVVEVGQVIVRRQTDGTLERRGVIDGRGRQTAAVQQCQVVGGGLPHAYVVQNADELLVLLAVDLLQLDSDVIRLRQGLRAEEVGCVVVGLQHLLVLGRHHGRQLLQVANHEQLHAAEGFIMVAVAAHHRVDGVEQVGAHHRDLVDDEQVERGQNLALLATEVELALYLGVGHEGREGQLEERVYGHAAGIDGRHARWCHDDGALARAFHHSAQEGCLARSGLACQENAASGVLHKVPRRAQLIVFLHSLDDFLAIRMQK